MRFNSSQDDFGTNLEMVKNKLAKSEIVASIDQLSCVVVEKWWNNLDKIVVPRNVTESSVVRAIEAVNKILIPAGFEKVGVSIRGGLMTDIEMASDLLAKNRILFSSGDLPIRNIFGGTSLKYWIEDVTVDEKKPVSLAQLVGYRLHNVINTKQLVEKYQQLRAKVTNIYGLKLIRWDIYGICDDAARIIPLLDEKTALAIEYYPRFGRPESFFEKIDELRKKYPGKQIGISFDPVYYQMASSLYKGCMTPENYFRKIISERPDQLMMLEVNQIALNQNKPHSAITDGKVNHYEMFNQLGKAYRSGRLYYLPHFAYEPSPKYYDQVLVEGKEYMVKLNESFMGNDEYMSGSKRKM